MTAPKCRQSLDYYYGDTCVTHLWSHMPDPNKPCERARIEAALAAMEQYAVAPQSEMSQTDALVAVRDALRGESDE